MNKKRVVITGMGVLSPIGIGKREFADSLREGKSGANPITAFDASNFATKFCANVKNFVPENFIDKKKARRMARFTQMGFIAAKMAIEDSKLDLSKKICQE